MLHKQSESCLNSMSLQASVVSFLLSTAKNATTGTGNEVGFNSMPNLITRTPFRFFRRAVPNIKKCKGCWGRDCKDTRDCRDTLSYQKDKKNLGTRVTFVDNSFPKLHQRRNLRSVHTSNFFVADPRFAGISATFNLSKPNFPLYFTLMLFCREKASYVQLLSQGSFTPLIIWSHPVRIS